MRLTLTRVLVARALLDRSTEPQWGGDICARLGLPGGTVYPILRRMCGEGWLEDEWETDAPVQRHARRYYQITGDGLRGLEQMLTRARVDARFTHLFVKPPAPTFQLPHTAGGAGG